MKYGVVRGSFREMGEQHGEMFRSEIIELARIRKDYIFLKSPFLKKETLSEICSAMLNYIYQNIPDLKSEIGGVCAASGIKDCDLIIGGGLTDILDIVANTEANTGRIHECTVVLDNLNKRIYGTWDTHKTAADTAIILERHPTGGPATLALTTPGWPVQQGINSAGLAFAITNLITSACDEYMLNYIAAIATVSRASSVDDVRKIFDINRFASAHSYLILDSKSNAAYIETSADSVCWANVPLSDVFVAANHFQTHPIEICNQNLKIINQSQVRVRRAWEDIVPTGGQSDQFAKALFGATEVNKVAENDTAMTGAHFILEPISRTIFYGAGPSFGLKMNSISLNVEH